MSNWGNSCPVGTLFNAWSSGNPERDGELCLAIEHTGDNHYKVMYSDGVIGHSYAGKPKRRITREALGRINAAVEKMRFDMLAKAAFVDDSTEAIVLRKPRRVCW